MDFISALVYGFIQGLTEFLPVSSSGHLAILPLFLKIKDPGVLFDLSMHLGTALSILVYFRSQVRSLLFEGGRTIFLIITGKFQKVSSTIGEGAFVVNMMLATLSTFVLVLLMKKSALLYGRSPSWIAFNLFFFGLLMFLADRLAKSGKEGQMHFFSPKIALLIGLSQALAIFPGVSRSGSTLTMARFMRLSREEATRFSFLLSLPIILAGFLFKLPDFFQAHLAFDPLLCFFGMTMSFVVGIFTIHFFLKTIKKWGLAPFAFYRVVLAGVIFFLFLK